MRRKAVLAALTAALVSGCTSSPQVVLPPDRNPRVAERNLLPDPPKKKTSSEVKESVAEMQIPSAEVKPKVDADKLKRRWTLKTSHRTLKEAIEDFASQVDYEVIYEHREFELNRTRDLTISEGDFWDALTVLGEAYRKSDAAFQIQPTKFRQIVVIPMGQADAVRNEGSK